MIDTDKQAKELGELLEQKGYYKSYAFNGSWFWPLEKGLPLHRNLERLSPPGKSEFPLRISTDIHLGAGKGTLHIGFKVGYNETNGFTLEGMRAFRYGLGRKRLTILELHPGSWDKIPTRNEVDQKLALGRKRRRRLR